MWQMRPLSRGYVEAKSADPHMAPAINPRYLSEETDRRAAIGGLRMARRLFHASALAPYFVGEILPGANVVSDDELLDYARQYGSTVFHATCTCKMGPDTLAVVDDRLRVHGLDGLQGHRRLGDADRYVDQHQRADDHDRREGCGDDFGRGRGRSWRRDEQPVPRTCYTIPLPTAEKAVLRPRGTVSRSKMPCSSVCWYDFGGPVGSGILVRQTCFGSRMAAEFSSPFFRMLLYHEISFIKIIAISPHMGVDPDPVKDSIGGVVFRSPSRA